MAPWRRGLTARAFVNGSAGGLLDVAKLSIAEHDDINQCICEGRIAPAVGEQAAELVFLCGAHGTLDHAFGEFHSTDNYGTMPRSANTVRGDRISSTVCKHLAL